MPTTGLLRVMQALLPALRATVPEVSIMEVWDCSTTEGPPHCAVLRLQPIAVVTMPLTYRPVRPLRPAVR